MNAHVIISQDNYLKSFVQCQNKPTDSYKEMRNKRLSPEAPFTWYIPSLATNNERSHIKASSRDVF